MMLCELFVLGPHVWIPPCVDFNDSSNTNYPNLEDNTVPSLWYISPVPVPPYPYKPPTTLIRNHNILFPRHTNHSIHWLRQSFPSNTDYPTMERRNRSYWCIHYPDASVVWSNPMQFSHATFRYYVHLLIGEWITWIATRFGKACRLIPWGWNRRWVTIGEVIQVWRDQSGLWYIIISSSIYRGMILYNDGVSDMVVHEWRKWRKEGRKEQHLLSTRTRTYPSRLSMDCIACLDSWISPPRHRRRRCCCCCWRWQTW